MNALCSPIPSSLHCRFMRQSAGTYTRRHRHPPNPAGLAVIFPEVAPCMSDPAMWRYERTCVKQGRKIVEAKGVFQYLSL